MIKSDCISFGKIFLILGLFTMSCDNDHNNYKWGLKSIEFNKEIKLGNLDYIDEILFTPSKTSDKYELRLFFPNIDFERFTNKIEIIEMDILKQYDGFGYKIIDYDKNIVIKQFKVDFAKRFKGNSFNENKPLSLWMDTKINLSKSTNYKIELFIPKAKTNNSVLNNSLFVVGIAKDVSL